MWKLLVFANPDIVEEDKRLTPESVRRLFDLVWNESYETGAQDMATRITEINSQTATQFAGSLTNAFAKLTEHQKNTPNAEKKKKQPPKE